MNYEKLTRELKKIEKIAQSVHEKFQVKCFEVLLNHGMISGEFSLMPKQGNGGPAAKQQESRRGQGNPFPFPLQGAINMFMDETEISPHDIARIVDVDEERNFVFTANLDVKSGARGVVCWTLLFALGNAIVGKSFSVNPENLRVFCQDRGYYNSKMSTNFWRALSNQKTGRLFSGALKASGGTQNLTLEGRTELAKLIRAIIGSDS